MRAAVTPSLLVLLFSLLPLVALAASTAGVRRSAIAGSWYPGSPSLAAAEVTRMLRAAAAASPAPAGKPVALVVPHAGGRGREGHEGEQAEQQDQQRGGDRGSHGAILRSAARAPPERGP